MTRRRQPGPEPKQGGGVGLAEDNQAQEFIMAVIINKDGGSGGGSAVLGFILGAVMLVAGVIGFFMWDNYKSGGAPKAVVITQPK